MFGERVRLHGSKEPLGASTVDFEYTDAPAARTSRAAWEDWPIWHFDNPGQQGD